LKETRELFRQKAQTEKALRDTNYFSKTYLDKSLYSNQLEWNEFFNRNDRALIEAPVGHAKSELVAFIKLIQEVVKNRNIRIIYGTKTFSLAQDNIRRVAYQLRHNKKLVEDFGMFYDRDNKWTDDRIEVIRTDRSLKEPTITGIGLGGAIEGTRGDLGILDDPIDIESMRSEAERRSARDWFDNTFLGRLEPNARVWVIGSAWHEEDLYNHIADKPNFERKTYTAIIDDEKKIVLCPERFPYDLLMTTKRGMGSSAFNLRFQNDREASEGTVFKNDWLKGYTAIPHIADLKIYQGWDLAISEKETANYTACATIGVSSENLIYVLDIYRDKIDFPKQVKMVRKQIENWRTVIKAGIESVAYQRALAQHSRYTDLALAGIIVDVPVTRDKITKHRSFSVYFENGIILLDKSAHWYEDFKTEYLAFPYGKNDDQLDALEIAVNCAIGTEEYGGATSLSWGEKKGSSLSDKFTKDMAERRGEGGEGIDW
jgi:predicted phage terminase large subunit-like protein